MLLFCVPPQYLGIKPKEQLAKEREEEAAWRQAKQRLKVQQVSSTAGSQHWWGLNMKTHTAAARVGATHTATHQGV